MAKGPCGHGDERGGHVGDDDRPELAQNPTESSHPAPGLRGACCSLRRGPRGRPRRRRISGNSDRTGFRVRLTGSATRRVRHCEWCARRSRITASRAMLIMIQERTVGTSALDRSRRSAAARAGVRGPLMGQRSAMGMGASPAHTSQNTGSSYNHRGAGGGGSRHRSASHALYRRGTFPRSGCRLRPLITLHPLPHACSSRPGIVDASALTFALPLCYISLPSTPSQTPTKVVNSL